MTTTALSAARFKLAYNRPYIAHAVWALIPVEKPGLGTLAVDKFWRLYYDPVVEGQWSVDQLVAVLYHEVCHLLREHNERGEGKPEAMDWNLAADAEINDDIRQEGCWDLPGDPVMPEKFGSTDGKIAEVYYEAIQQWRKKNKQDKKDGNGPGGKKGDGDGPFGPLGPGSGKCGSAAGGNPGEHEDGPPSDSTPGVKPGEGEVLKQQIAHEVAEASKSRGDVPGHLQRWAKDRVEEKVDWRKTLSTLVRNAVAHASGAQDYTLKRPSRRSTKDIIFPSMVKPVAKVCVYIDTSGSMSDKELQQAVAEVGGIIKAQGVRDGLMVAAVDARMHVAKKVFKESDVDLKGGGGTDMREAYTHVQSMKPKPDIMVLITDGETPWPKHPPRGIVPIVVLTREWSMNRVPSWAKTVLIKDD